MCEICGSREDNPYAPQDFDLKKSRMSKYAEDFIYLPVCDRCYNAVKAYDAGDKDAFKNIMFAKPDVEKIFLDEEEILRRNKRFHDIFQSVEKEARMRCYEFHQMDDDCKKCGNKEKCMRENE